jgi:hypothetical protein
MTPYGKIIPIHFFVLIFSSRNRFVCLFVCLFDLNVESYTTDLILVKLSLFGTPTREAHFQFFFFFFCCTL